MDFQVRISDPALIDFEDILEYSWANFPANAEHFGNAIHPHPEPQPVSRNGATPVALAN